MEVLIFVSGIFNFILLVMLLIMSLKRNNKTGDGEKLQADIINAFNELKNKFENSVQTNSVESKHLLDAVDRQGNSIINRIIDLQDKQQSNINIALDKIELEMKELRDDNRESFTQINSIITEKMQKILDEKLNGISDTIVNTMSVLSKNLTESQDKQQENTVKELNKLGNNFNDIRIEISTTLKEIQKSNMESMDKLRKDNQESLDRINGTLNESQEKQLKNTEEKLEKLRKDFGTINTLFADMLLKNTKANENLQKNNQESLDKINTTVNEKLQKTLDEKLSGMSETVEKNVLGIQKRLDESQDRQQKITTEKLENLENGFEKIRSEINITLDKIRTSNSDSMEKLRRDNQESLDKINNTVNEKLQKTLDDKFSQSFEAVNKRLIEVREGLGEMKNVASGVSDLKNVLSNVKTRGTLGEIQLEAIMSEILNQEQYGKQVSISPNRAEKVDFAIKLPGTKEGSFVYLPIDSKFPGDTYQNLIDAYKSDNSHELKEKRKLLENEIKRCAKSIHDKYIDPPFTTGFAIMFLPFEGLYAEVVNMGLIELLQNKFKINIAGPSTMAAMINSLRMGFQTLEIQKKSGEVWETLEEAKKEFLKFEEVLTKTRNRLRQADAELDTLIGTRTRAINRSLSAVSGHDSLKLIENDSVH